MKKYYTSGKYKAQSEIRRKKFDKRNARTKYKRSVGLHLKKHYPLVDDDRLEIYNDAHYRKTSHDHLIDVWAPEILSFIRNPNDVLAFINRLRSHFLDRLPVFVKLDNVREMDHDGIVILLSIMVRFKAFKIDFNGSFPKDAVCKDKLKRSGFLKYLYSEFENTDEYNLSKSLIHTSANKDVDSELSSKLIEEASVTVWGQKRRCQGVQRALIELMHNTNNHANLLQERHQHFWISVNHMPEENKVSFTFLDFGVGVFTSLNNKPVDNKFGNWLPKMLAKFSFETNAKLLDLILNGQLHETVTGKAYRGKGLPGIKEVFDRNDISNLHIITNDVHAMLSVNKYSLIEEQFHGTFVYWELNTSNKSCNWYE
ncbi:hypothetical protein [Dyadobacter sp. MSC1_007]|jgi:hypothetical protein|uniref:hypothetical protein n=1 Tax=Dyadobacter sp. MSC1_007 TaxID=2909264 RepID=UPI00202F126A|nr:hypothetical protein [Dyadobacter sp. MSC1_007]